MRYFGIVGALEIDHISAVSVVRNMDFTVDGRSPLGIRLAVESSDVPRSAHHIVAAQLSREESARLDSLARRIGSGRDARLVKMGRSDLRREAVRADLVAHDLHHPHAVFAHTSPVVQLALGIGQIDHIVIFEGRIDRRPIEELQVALHRRSQTAALFGREVEREAVTAAGTSFVDPHRTAVDQRRISILIHRGYHRIISLRQVKIGSFRLLDNTGHNHIQPPRINCHRTALGAYRVSSRLELDRRGCTRLAIQVDEQHSVPPSFLKQILVILIIPIQHVSIP